MSAGTDAGRRTGKPRGPYRKSREVRRRILDAALEVFSHSGYRSGSLREIAARVDMSEAGVLHHFPSKEAMLAAVLAHRDDRAQEIVEADPDDGVATLRAMVELAALSSTQPGVVGLFCVVAAEATSPEHPAHEFFVERYRRMRERTARALEMARAAGALADGVDPARAAGHLIALWDGLQVQWLLDRERLDVAAELARHLETLLTVPLVVGTPHRDSGTPVPLATS